MPGLALQNYYKTANSDQAEVAIAALQATLDLEPSTKHANRCQIQTYRSKFARANLSNRRFCCFDLYSRTDLQIPKADQTDSSNVYMQIPKDCL